MVIFFDCFSGDSESSKNLLSSATDAVMSIVKKAAEVLGNKANNSNQTSLVLDENNTSTSSSYSTCITPIHQIICENCTKSIFEEIYELISCRSLQLMKILVIPYIKDTLSGSNLCRQFGLKSGDKHTNERRFVESVFTKKYIGALCNLIAVMQSSGKLNVSGETNETTEGMIYSNATRSVNLESLETVKEDQPSLPFTGIINEEPVDAKTSVPSANVKDLDVSDIKPTQTETTEEVVSIPTKDSKEVVRDTNIPVTSSVMLNKSEESGEKVFSSEVENEYENASDSLESTDEQFDMADVSIESSQAANTQQIAQGVVQKESVFLRLSNRIKVEGFIYLAVY